MYCRNLVIKKTQVLIIFYKYIFDSSLCQYHEHSHLAFLIERLKWKKFLLSGKNILIAESITSHAAFHTSYRGIDAGKVMSRSLLAFFSLVLLSTE